MGTNRIVILCTVFLLLAVSCKNKAINTKQPQMSLSQVEISQIKQHMDYQKRIESDEIEQDNPYKMTEQDLILASKIVLEGLKSQGFIKISEEAFNQKLKEVFGIEKLKSVHNKIHAKENYISILDKEDQFQFKKILEDEFGNSSLMPILFLMRKDHIITEAETLKNIIQINSDKTYKITIQPHIIHRNKYLFNNDKASLAWLLNNEQYFLIKLLDDFGYDKEPKINKMVLDSIYKKNLNYSPLSGQRIANLFFVKDLNNKLEIRKGLLKYVEANTSSTDNRFIYALGSFISTLYYGDGNKIFDEDPSKKFTAVEKAEIVANIANIENPAIEKYKSLESSDVWNLPGSSLYNLSVSHPEVIIIIEQHNYFGLPKMKAIIAKLQEEAPPTGADPE